MRWIKETTNSMTIKAGSFLALFAVVSFASVGTSYAGAGVDSLDRQRAQLAQIGASIDEIDARMQATRKKLLEKSDEIGRWKQNSVGNPTNPFVDYRLQSLLKEAHARAKELSAMEAERLQLAQTAQVLRNELLGVLEQQIEATAARLRQKGLSEIERRGLAQALSSSIKERAALASSQPATLTSIDDPHLIPSDADSLDELQAKAALLGDMRDRLQQNLEEVHQKVAMLQRQKLLFEEARHLMDEEAFFAETNFSKSQPFTSNFGSTNAKSVETKAEAGSLPTPPGVAAVQNEAINNNNPAEQPIAAADPNLSNVDESTIEANLPIRHLQMEEVATAKKSQRVSFAGHLNDLKDRGSALNRQLSKINDDLAVVHSMIRLLEQGKK